MDSHLSEISALRDAKNKLWDMYEAYRLLDQAIKNLEKKS